MRLGLSWYLLLVPFSALATESEFSGVADVRYIGNHSSQSYVTGGIGKFRFDDHTSSLQLGLAHRASFDSGLSSHISANAYLDGMDNAAGLLEARLGYRGLPSASGWRIEGKLGLFYPEISLENVATAWNSPYSLSFSTLNGWIGEELRSFGLGTSLTRLGRFHDSSHDVRLGLELFGGNDTAGAMLAWHGWLSTSRQTLLQEKLPIAYWSAMGPGGALRWQARNSDPFIELDNRIGAHLFGQWRWQGQGLLQGGYYDNNANTRVVKQGQYAWDLRFWHLGFKWRLPWQLDAIGQWLQGETLMTSPFGLKVVDMGYSSGFLLLSRGWLAHRVSLRLEHFDASDRDQTIDDHNDESGEGLTLAYQYSLSQELRMQLEYQWLKSDRDAREYFALAEDQTERQWQLALRYWF